MKKKNKVKIDIITDNSLIIPEYKINIKNRTKKTIELVENFEKLVNLKDKVDEKNMINKTPKKFKKKIYKKKRFYKKIK